MKGLCVFGLILLFAGCLYCKNLLDVLKIANVPFPSSSGHAAVVNASFGQEIPEFTICIRILIDSYNDGAILLLDARRPSTAKNENYFGDILFILSGFELDGFQSSFLFLRRNIPGGEMFLGGGLGNRSNPYFMHVNHPENIDTSKWYNFCTAYSSLKHRLHKYQDGMKVFGFTYPDKVENPFPSTLFETLEIGGNMRGLINDLNIYSSFFDEEAMIDWTTGCDHMKGDIFKWDAKNVEIKIDQDNKKIVSFVKMDKSEVCPDPNLKRVKQKPSKSAGNNEKKRFKPKPQEKDTFIGSVLEYMEDQRDKSANDAKEMCLRLNGELITVPQNQEEEKMMNEMMLNFMMKKTSNNMTYIDENQKQLNLWVAGETILSKEEKTFDNIEREQIFPERGEMVLYHPYTGAKLNPQKPMLMPYQATDLRVRQNCINCQSGMNKPFPDSMWMWQKTAWCFYVSCSQLRLDSAVCRFRKAPSFSIRGLCKDALMDTQYKLAEPKPMGIDIARPGHDWGGETRSYVGPKGWVIAKNNTDKKWRITHYHYTAITVTMLDKDILPLGRHKWRMENNVCNEGVTSSVVLQVSGCDEGEFTCDDGKCLDISQRCNNIEVNIENTYVV